jgi:cellulose synthase/poly-beta-1,6-N-acetylglucosamine synthase-like glycosyltransferase
MNISEYYVIIVLLLFLGLAVLVILEQVYFSQAGKFSPTVSIIIPVRGLDPEWEKNADSFRHLSYSNSYDTIYVVDADDALTADTLRKAGLKVIISSTEYNKCGAKVAAQLTGLMGSEGEAVVFADSDIRVDQDWLSNIVGPLDRYDAVTTFSWPLPLKNTWLNIIRGGFWIIGYDSHISAGGFLWGGSMAFKRETLDSEYIAFMSDKIYDDVTTTSYLKSKKKRICFNGKAVCFNAYDDGKFYKWASRQEMLVRRYSHRIAVGFFLFMLGFLATSIYGIIILNPFFLSIYILWWLKGVFTSIRIGRVSFGIPAVSILSSMIAFFILILTLMKKQTEWRDHIYNF